MLLKRPAYLNPTEAELVSALYDMKDRGYVNGYPSGLARQITKDPYTVLKYLRTLIEKGLVKEEGIRNRVNVYKLTPAGEAFGFVHAYPDRFIDWYAKEGDLVIPEFFKSNVPQFAEPLILLGLLYYRMGNYSMAHDYLMSGTEIDPDSRVSKYFRLRCINNDPELKEKYGNSLSILAKETRRTPKKGKVQVHDSNEDLGIFLEDLFGIIDTKIKTGSLNGAIKYFEEIRDGKVMYDKISPELSIDNDDPDKNDPDKTVFILYIVGYLYLIESYSKMLDPESLKKSWKNYSQAIELIEKNKDLNKTGTFNPATAWRALAEIDLHLGNTEKALEEVEKAISLANDYTYAYATKGIILKHLKKNDDSQAYFNEALDKKQKSKELIINKKRN